jgi:predicted anti-sigma-YlaC factor YlaD
MSCERYQLLMTGYLDGELTATEQTEFLQHLRTCAACEEELRQHRQLKEITGNMQFFEPEDRVWQFYWSGIYNRLERKIAWILLMLGIVLLLSYGTFYILEQVILYNGVSWVIRIGVISVIVGFYGLLASVIRERLALRASDRYKDIKR